MTIRKYRKTATIKAEQFAESLEMMEKYPIGYSPFLSVFFRHLIIR